MNDKRLTPFTRFFNISFSKFSKWLWVCRFNNPISFRQSDEKLIFIAKNCFIFFQGKTSEKKTLPENGLTLFLSIKKKKIVVKSKQTVYCKILCSPISMSSPKLSTLSPVYQFVEFFLPPHSYQRPESIYVLFYMYFCHNTLFYRFFNFTALSVRTYLLGLHYVKFILKLSNFLSSEINNDIKQKRIQNPVKHLRWSL